MLRVGLFPATLFARVLYLRRQSRSRSRCLSWSRSSRQSSFCHDGREWGCGCGGVHERGPCGCRTGRGCVRIHDWDRNRDPERGCADRDGRDDRERCAPPGFGQHRQRWGGRGARLGARPSTNSWPTCSAASAVSSLCRSEGVCDVMRLIPLTPYYSASRGKLWKSHRHFSYGYVLQLRK